MRFFLLSILLLIQSSLRADNTSVLLPKPQKITVQEGEFLNIVNIDLIEENTHIKLVDTIQEVPINLNEAYKLKVTKEGVLIEATTERGVYWAKQTLSQLTTKKFDGFIKIPLCEITDWPAFRIRGFMQDVGRSFISVEELKRQIEVLSKFKINTFHWHLTEDIAWRLESKIYPQLTDSVNMMRMSGKFYTQDEARELVEFCSNHNMILIPEIDMPGHSAAFERAFHHSMQSEEGMKILKELINEACEVFKDVEYFHIGTDEVKFTNPNFVPEMVEFIRARGKKVISWNPGWKYKKGEIDMTQLWSYRGEAQDGIPAIDSKYHYLNHFDTFGDIVALYNSRIYNQAEGSENIAGVILASWHDRNITEENMSAQNNFYPNMMAIAERSWLGGGTEYFDKNGTILSTDRKSKSFITFEDFERRMLWHKNNTFQNFAFPYVKQTHINWRITDPFPNGGDLNKVFPPERKIEDTYQYNGEEYKNHLAIGAGIYLRHVWGDLIPAFYENPKENHTAYAYTWVYSPFKQRVGLWAEFQNYSRSEKDLPPPKGKWDYKVSKIWINDEEIEPPTWLSQHLQKSNEIPLTNENLSVRKPIPVTLKKGWNKVFMKLPIGKFTTSEVRLVKWMFTAIFVDIEGKKAIDNITYSPEKIK